MDEAREGQEGVKGLCRVTHNTETRVIVGTWTLLRLSALITSD